MVSAYYFPPRLLRLPCSADEKQFKQTVRTVLLVTWMNTNPEKTAKIFVAMISIAIFAVAVGGAMIDGHQHLIEEKEGLWEPLSDLVHDDTMAVISFPSFHHLGLLVPVSFQPS